MNATTKHQTTPCQVLERTGRSGDWHLKVRCPTCGAEGTVRVGSIQRAWAVCDGTGPRADWKPLSAEERERQATRRRDGKYDKMPRCYGGCGRPVNPQGSYYSHPLTDCVDSEGQGFGDLALMLCRHCMKGCQDLTTVREVRAFIAHNEARVAVQHPEQRCPDCGRAGQSVGHPTCDGRWTPEGMEP